MLRIGLTGGFQTGKTTVAKFLRQEKILVIDLDKLYHGLLVSCKTLKADLIQRFGSDIQVGGSIVRSRLRKKAISTRNCLKELTICTHPYIIAALEQQLKRKKNIPLLVVDAPLLFEAGIEDLFDSIIVVSAPLDLQRKRAKARGWDARFIRVSLASQMPLSEKRKKADHVIVNNTSRFQLQKKVKRLSIDLKTQSSILFDKDKK